MRSTRKLAAAPTTRAGGAGDLGAAARRLFEAERRPRRGVRDATLVQVADQPGTNQDHAVFRITTAAGDKHLTLGRSGGTWVSDGVS